MKVFFRKLILGRPTVDRKPTEGAIQKRIRNIEAIFNNDHDDDIGLEKMLRLFLSISQLLFLGTYVKQLFYKKGIAKQELAVDMYVVVKVCFPIMILITNTQQNHFCYFLNLWFLFETMLYVPAQIFASDLYSRPRSYRRSMLLLFLNYFEIVLCFGVIYAQGQYLNSPFVGWFDPIYFSIMTSATVGYGDYYPVTTFGKFLVSAQSVLFLIFVVLFLNFYSNKVEHHGYFDHNNDPL